MHISKCPHCHVKLGNFMYADVCPHCDTELEHNRKRTFVAPQPDPHNQWLLNTFLRVRGFVES